MEANTEKKPLQWSMIIIGINVAIYLVMVIFDGPQSLFSGFSGDILQRMGSNYFISVTDGQWFRLFTAGFIHSNFMHLASNMLGIYVFGRLVENFFGEKKFLIIYLGSIFIGNALSYAMLTTHAVGSSTGVFGLLGIHLYLFIINREGYLRSFGKDILGLIILNIVISIVYPSIDLWGHLGGLLGGFILAFGLGHRYDNSINIKKVGACLFAVLLFFSLSFTGYTRNQENFDYHFVKWATYHNEGQLEKSLDEFRKLKELRPDYTFPNQPEKLIEAYEDAIKGSN